jgi:hypothetical protein
MRQAKLRKKRRFSEPNSGKYEPIEPYSAGVNMIPVRLAGARPVPSPQDSLALPNGRAGTGAWLQAVLLTLLAWAAAVCTGLGGNLAVASQSLANNLAANAQHLQRHGGTSLASRAVRRDQAAATSVQHVAQDSLALAWDLTDGALPAGEVGLQIDAQQTDDPPLAATEPHLKPHKRAHPSRAPPVPA